MRESNEAQSQQAISKNSICRFDNGQADKIYYPAHFIQFYQIKAARVVAMQHPSRFINPLNLVDSRPIVCADSRKPSSSTSISFGRFMCDTPVDRFRAEF